MLTHRQAIPCTYITDQKERNQQRRRTTSISNHKSTLQLQYTYCTQTSLPFKQMISLNNCPKDSVSCVRFAPSTNILAAASWDSVIVHINPQH